MGRAEITFSNLRTIDEVKVDDPDLYAVGRDGVIYQRSFKFSGCDDSSPQVGWVIFNGGGHCLAASKQYREDLEEHDGDPRSLSGDPRMLKKYRGIPDERLA